MENMNTINKIKIYNTEYELMPIADYTQHDIERKKWCEHNLSDFFKSTGCGIKKTKYYKTKGCAEVLKILYSEEEDTSCYKWAWITADSKAAIVEDMYIQKVIY